MVKKLKISRAFKYSLGVVFTLLVSLLLGPLQTSLGAITTSVPVELEVPDTTLRVQGIAAPNALVTIREGSSVIGTTTANNQGIFNTVLNSQQTGVRKFSVFYTDQVNKNSATYQKSISIMAQQETVLDVYLSPTINRKSTAKVKKGSVVLIDGYTRANAKVELNVQGPSAKTTTVTANSSGFYAYLIDTSSLVAGNYKVAVSSSFEGSSSQRSSSVDFSVVPVSDPSVPDIVVSPQQLPPPVYLSLEDGAVIDGNSVVIYGDSLPNAQINIYQDGVLYGTVAADGSGRWSFLFTADYSPVTLTFESCLGGQCSVLSSGLTLIFNEPNEINETCRPSAFGLKEYRFWGLHLGEQIMLELTDEFEAENGVFRIDWGDSITETFSVNEYERSFTKSYDQVGTYNGSITNTDDASGCEYTRYFSVHMNTNAAEFQLGSVAWLISGVGIIFLAIQYYENGRRNGMIKHKDK